MAVAEIVLHVKMTKQDHQDKTVKIDQRVSPATDNSTDPFQAQAVDAE